MKTIIIVILLSFSRLLYSQDTINHFYFDNLKSILLKDKNVKEVKFKEKRFSNGKVKCQAMYVKLNNDKINRFWGVGKYYCFYKNGHLRGFGNIDIRTKTFRDTSYSYDENYQIIAMSIFNNNSRHSEVSEPIFKFWNNEYVCYPDSIIDIEFKNGKKIREYGSKFNASSKYYERNFDIRYNEDGTVIEKKMFKNGKPEE